MEKKFEEALEKVAETMRGLYQSQQAALSIQARTRIAYGIYRSIVEDKDFEPSQTDWDYMDEYTQPVAEKMAKFRELVQAVIQYDDCDTASQSKKAQAHMIKLAKELKDV